MLKELRETPVAEGEERVYFAGLPEYEEEQRNNEIGVPVLRKTYDNICEIGKEFGLEGPKILGS
jgi:LDH2 family malate/lactate/ureidoglycolate dehydrogenase